MCALAFPLPFMHTHNFLLSASPSVTLPATTPTQLRSHPPTSTRLWPHRGVAVVHPADELLEEVARLVLAEAPRPHDALKQLAARRVLHHYAQVARRQKHLGGWPGGGRQVQGEGRGGGSEDVEIKRTSQVRWRGAVLRVEMLDFVMDAAVSKTTGHGTCARKAAIRYP